MKLTFKKCGYKRKIIVAALLLITLYYIYIPQLKYYNINYNYFSYDYQLIFLTPIIFIVILFLMCEKSKLFWGLNVALCVAFATLLYAWPTPSIYSTKDIHIGITYMIGYIVISFTISYLFKIFKTYVNHKLFEIIKWTNIILILFYAIRPFSINNMDLPLLINKFITIIFVVVFVPNIIVSPIFFIRYIYLTYKNREKKKLLKK